MIIDKTEIDKLIDEAKDATGAAERGPSETSVGKGAAAAEDVARLLRIRVPVIVRLAKRRTTVQAARKISQGTIIEFTKHIDDPLDLLINNRKIGEGVAVKCGERFGLLVGAIASPSKRIESLGA